MLAGFPPRPFRPPSLLRSLALLWGLRLGLAEPPPALAEDYISLQLHIHGSLSEGRGRMVNHAARARSAGVDALWWTDHMLSIQHVPQGAQRAFGMGFEEALLVVPSSATLPISRGFVPLYQHQGFVHAELVDSTASQGSWCMALSSEGLDTEVSGQFNGYRFWVGSAFSPRSVMQEIDIRFDARSLEPYQSGRDFAVSCVFSNDLAQRPIQLYFLATNEALPPDTENERFHAIEPLLFGEWGSVHIPVSDLARQFDEFGRDLSFREAALGWWTRVGGASAVLIDEFHIEISGAERDSLLALQGDFLESLPDPSPSHMVGYETYGSKTVFARDTDHLNVFAPNGVPRFPDYSDPRFLAEEYPRNVARWARARGYFVSFNHLFGATGTTTDAERDSLQARVVANKAFGCDLFEVGYVLRAARPIEDLTVAWDDLLRHDAFVTGVGTSDAHDALPWVGQTNRHVTWVWSVSRTQADLLQALAAGRACFGDPLVVGPEAQLRLSAELEGGEFEMGDVVVSELQETSLYCTGQSELPDAEVALITVHSDHADTARFQVEGTEAFVLPLAITISDTCHVRAELRHTSGLQLLSNPIHFRRTAPSRTKTGMRERRIVTVLKD